MLLKVPLESNLGPHANMTTCPSLIRSEGCTVTRMATISTTAGDCDHRKCTCTCSGRLLLGFGIIQIVLALTTSYARQPYDFRVYSLRLACESSKPCLRLAQQTRDKLMITDSTVYVKPK